MSKYIKLECSIFDMKEMLDNCELYCAGPGSGRYYIIHTEYELVSLVSDSESIYRQKTQEEIEAQEVEELARLLCDKNDKYWNIGFSWNEVSDKTKLLYMVMARASIEWMKDKNNDQKN